MGEVIKKNILKNWETKFLKLFRESRVDFTNENLTHCKGMIKIPFSNVVLLKLFHGCCKPRRNKRHVVWLKCGKSCSTV